MNDRQIPEIDFKINEEDASVGLQNFFTYASVLFCFF